MFSWCSRFLHSRRKEKPDGLFSVVPSPGEMNLLVAQLSASASLPNCIEVVFQWIKDKLRRQIEQAGARFCDDMTRDLSQAFEELRERQISECDHSYRPEDARRVHAAVVAAVLRRVDALRLWFDGVDEKTGTPVSLAQLAQAAETLFENVLPDRTLVTRHDASASAIYFSPHEVKVAFDLVREVSFNALKHAPGPTVTLHLTRKDAVGPVTFVFCNEVGGGQTDDSGYVVGARYTSVDEALTREGNSGRLKIAASAATLLGRDARLEWTRRAGRYELTVPMRPEHE